MPDPIPAEAAFAALDEVRAERDRYREALKVIADNTGFISLDDIEDFARNVLHSHA